MTKTRKVLAVTALCALLGPITACSSSDSDASDASSSPTPAAPTWKETTAPCTANVKLTGAVKAAWTGEATTAQGDGRGASYTSTNADGSISVTILPKQGDIPAAPIVTADGVTYSAQDGKGTKADPKGKQASTDADAVVLEDGKTKKVHVVAKFTC